MHVDSIEQSINELYPLESYDLDMVTIALPRSAWAHVSTSIEFQLDYAHTMSGAADGWTQEEIEKLVTAQDVISFIICESKEATSNA